MGMGLACTPCSPGRYDNDYNPNTFCTMCSAGTVSEGGTTFCTDCPTGTHALAGTYNSQSAYFYSGALEFGTGCFQCPTGRYSGDKASECSLCGFGWYDDDRDPSTVCVACPVGSYSPQGVTACTDCASGLYDHDSRPSTECVGCDPGTYSNSSAFGTRTRSMLDATAACVEIEGGDPRPCAAVTDLGTAAACEAVQTISDGDEDVSERACTYTPAAWVASLEPPHCSEAHKLCRTVVDSDEECWAMATPECAQARQDNELLNDISCPECEPGQHDHDSDPSTPCIWCGAGQVSWRPGTGGPTAQQALAGELPPGQVWIGRGSWKSTGCEECSVGMYGSPNATRCTDCSRGAYAARNGMVECDICQKGTMSGDKASVCTLCENGAFASQPNSSSCELCSVGRYGNGSKAQSECLMCPEGTGHTMIGGTRLRSCCKPGTWADTAQGHETCHACAHPVHCSGDGECDEGREGNWCSRCVPGQFPLLQRCYGCPHIGLTIGVGVVLLLLLSIFIVNIATTKKKPGDTALHNAHSRTVAAVPVTILVTRLQVALPVFKLGLGWPRWMEDGFGMMNVLINFDISAAVAPECFTRAEACTPIAATIEQMAAYGADAETVCTLTAAKPLCACVRETEPAETFLERCPCAGSCAVASGPGSCEYVPPGDPAVTYLIRTIERLAFFPLLCLQIIVVFFCFKLCMWRPKGYEVTNANVVSACVAAYSFLLISLMSSGFEPFGCTLVADQVSLLDAQRELVCFEGIWYVLALIGVVMLTIYMVVVPVHLFRKLLRMRVSHSGDNLLRTEKNEALKARYGWVLERYRPAAWFYECTTIFQRILCIGITNIFVDGENVATGCLLHLVLTFVALKVHLDTKPYPEIPVDIEPLFRRRQKKVSKVLQPVLNCMKGVPKLLAWNSVEVLGLAAQLSTTLAGAFYIATGDSDSALAHFVGVIAALAYSLFIFATLCGMILRYWALARAADKHLRSKRTPLHDFAQEALLSKAINELAEGSEINALDEENETPLFVATKNGNIEVVAALLNAGADPNIPCGGGRWTTLHGATSCEALQLLFNGGADATLQDAWGKTAEDVHLEEADNPPVPERGERQTDADRERHRIERERMAEMIADKCRERVCDWAFKRWCPKRRTKQITPYGAILLERPKRPGMNKLKGSKEDIMRYFFKRYGSEVQMKQVEKILAGVLVGQTEEDNYDLFMKYCDKMQKLHGHNPKTVWRTRSDAEAEAEAERMLKLDGYGGSGKEGKLAEKAFRRSDYKKQRRDEKGRLLWHTSDEESDPPTPEGSDEETETEAPLPGAAEGSPDRDIRAVIKEKKQQLATRARQKRLDVDKASRVHRPKASGLLPGGANTNAQKMTLSPASTEGRESPTGLMSGETGECKCSRSLCVFFQRKPDEAAAQTTTRRAGSNLSSVKALSRRLGVRRSSGSST